MAIIGNNNWTQAGWKAVASSGIAQAATQFSMPVDGYVSTLHGYFDGWGSGNGILVVWGSNGNIVCASTSFGVVAGSHAAGGQHTYSASVPTSGTNGQHFMAAGTTYWVGVAADNGLIISSGTGGSSSQDTAGTLPSAFTGPVGTGIGQVEAYGDIIQPLPGISGVSATTGFAGQTLVVSGTYLDRVGVVQLNGTNCSFTIQSPNQLTVTIPSGATTGNLVLFNPWGSTTYSTPITIYSAYRLHNSAWVAGEVDVQRSGAGAPGVALVYHTASGWVQGGA